MTIGYVLDDSLDRSDGVQQTVINIGEKMRSLGHDVHYIVAETERTDLKNIHSIGEYWSVQFNGNSVRTPKPASKKVIRELFEDVHFDVLHVQTPFSPFLASRVIKQAPEHVRIVGTFHILPYGFLAQFGAKLLGLLQWRTIRKFDMHYATSEPAKKFMERAFGVKGYVLGNPVDFNFFSSAVRRQSNEKKIVFVGRFEQRKGVKELAQAYKELDSDTRKYTQLIMVSKGPLLDELKAYSDTHDLHIEFPGFVTEAEKAQFLADADIAVYPSTSGESFGVVLIEAMAAHGGVTIGGDNPGYRSVLRPWPETLFDPKDAAAFSKLLKKFLDNEALRTEIATQQHDAAKRYDINKICQRLLNEAYSQAT